MTVTRTLAAGAAALTLALSGCADDGGEKPGKGSVDVTEGKSAEEILDATVEAIGDAEFISLAGSITSDGSELTLDVDYSGDDAAGTVSVAQGQISLLKHGADTWFRGDEAFYRSFAGADADAFIEVVGDKWIVASSPDLADLVSLASPSFITEEILEPEGDIEVGDLSEVDGVECRLLVADDGELCVSTADGLPLRIASSKEEGSVTFTYEEQEIEPAPAEADTIDLDAL